MEFKNYLKKLSENEYVNNQSPICAWNLSGLLKEMHLEMKTNYNFPLLNLIASSLQIKSQNCRDFYHWLKGQNPIPLPKFFKFVDLWKEICKKSSEDHANIIQRAFKISNHFSTKRGKKVKLPKSLTPNLAYLIGFISGDGSILDPIKEKENTGDFEFRISLTDENKYVLKYYINPYFKSLFGIEGRYYKYKNKNAYGYYISAKILFLFIHKICELPKGKKAGKLKIPKVILQSNNKIKAHYLAGFFDSDGFITVNKKIGFGLGKKERNLMEELKKLFTELDINTRPITTFGNKTTNLWGWEMTLRWNSIQNFINQIPSKNPKKSKRLNKLRKTL